MYNRPYGRKIDQTAIKYTIARPSKLFPNWDFGLKICHLATLLLIRFSARKRQMKHF
jgi:hypothetical protein